APDVMAGKKVKCKQCGNVFTITPEPSEEFSDESLAALAELERSHHGEEGPSDSTMRGAAAQQAPPPRPGMQRQRDDEGEEREIALAPIGIGRPNVRFNFPYAREIDQWAPILLVLVFLPLVAVMAFKLD